MSSPLGPTIVESLRRSAAAPVVNRPVNDILADMGLPRLPALPPAAPLPDLPPLPILDLSALTKPLTDLAGSFGTGQLGAPVSPKDNAKTGVSEPSPALDPAQLMSAVGTVLQSVSQLGSTAAQALGSMWQGAGASAAGAKQAQASGDTAAL
ncbi:MAG: hypothetical protein HOQ24_09850, partial [Mycobacteriaceae bacterium]|nr:hypothetical protein [Mycobacteriaceae bacterium]